MKTHHLLSRVALSLLTLVLVQEARAGGSARSLGLGESAIALPDPELLGRDNPAFLGVAKARGLRLSLFDVSAELGNNAFSFGDYARWNGAALTEEDETEILSRVDGEWSVAGGGVGYAPGFAFGPVSLTTRGVGRGGGRIPKAVLEVIFDGNTSEEVTDFSTAGGGGWAAAELALAYGHSLGGAIAGGETTVGLRASYLQGVLYAGVINAEGQLVTRPDTLHGSASLDLRTASGGSGFQVDVGAVHNRGSLNLGARIVGALGSMRWNRETEITHFEAEVRTPDFLGEGDEDVFTTSDSTYVAEAFSTALPLRIGLGAAYEIRGWLLAGDLEHTARGLYAREDPWRLSAGAERGVLGGHVRPRIGGMLGGTAGPSLTAGVSFRAGPWRLDLDAATFRTPNPFDPKGGRFAVGTGFVIG